MEFDALQRCLKRYPEIVAAYLFGSAVSGKMTPMSDIDVALIVRDEATLDEILLLPEFCNVFWLTLACG